MRDGSRRASLAEEISRVLPVCRQLQSVAAAHGWASGRDVLRARTVSSFATLAFTLTSTSVEATTTCPALSRRSIGSPPPPMQLSGTPPSGLCPSGMVRRRATFATLPPRTLDAAAVATDAATADAATADAATTAAANAISRVAAGDACLSGRRARSKVKGLCTLGWRSIGSARAPAPDTLASQRAGFTMHLPRHRHMCIAPHKA